MQASMKRKHWTDAQERIQLGVSEQSDLEMVAQQRNELRYKPAQELVTLLSIIFLAVEFVAVIAICCGGAQ